MWFKKTFVDKCCSVVIQFVMSPSFKSEHFESKNKVKFESVLAGILNISQISVSASFADTVGDKKILNASV